jgi:transposase
MMMPGSLRILVCRERVDFRRSFNGLCGFVRDVLGEDPRSATLFVFRNNRCNLDEAIV